MERQVISMDRGWRFHEGDIERTRYMWHDILYMSTRTASARGADRRDYDDRDWRLVDLPHDYVVEGTPTQEAAPSHGSLIRNNAWYRKTFVIPEEYRGKHISIYFEGVCSTCEVTVNGVPMGHNFTAGIGFEIDITDVAQYGEDVNVAAVYIDNREYEGWYYEGGGIYRHVWLIVTDKVYTDLWGTFVKSTPVGGDRWLSRIETDVKNDSDEDREITLRSEIFDPEGRLAASTESARVIPARSAEKIIQETAVDAVRRWSLEEPNLYSLKTTIISDGETADTYSTDFGYRTIEYTADDGFLLNGKKTFILGYGSHQDLTGFGIGITDSIQEFRMKRLKGLGFNLFRTAHNPFSPALYETCDRIGMLCMDENRRFRSTPEVVDEVQRMVKRDRNHPCVIMWSVFNEEDNRRNRIGSNIYRSLKAAVLKVDDTRPVTGGDNVATAIPGAMDDIDLIGINHVYSYEELDKVRTNNPHKPIFLSEEHLTTPIREYVRTRPYIFGAIGWAGLPYRGETKWPELHSARPGAIAHPFNLLCDPYDMYYWNRATWVDEPVLKIVTHWTHPGKENEEIPVKVYTNCPEIELFINGKSIGKYESGIDRTVDAVVCYEPGILTAEGSWGGQKVSDAVETVGEAAALKLFLENPGVRKNGRDTAIISAVLVDGEGRVLPEAPALPVEFTVKKGGRFLCVGSPNAGDHESWQIPRIRLWDNKAQAYFESDAKEDVLEVEAACEGFEPVVIRVEKEPGTPVPEVPWEDNRFLEKWYISPAIVNEPLCDLDRMHESVDPTGWMYFEVARGSSNSFDGILGRVPEGESVKSVQLVYCHRTKVPACVREYSRISLVFEKFEGIGEAALYSGDKCFKVEKTTFPPAPVVLETEGLKPGDEVEVWVRLKADTMFCAVNKPVRWSFEQ